jgi:hypothetical protein
MPARVARSFQFIPAESFQSYPFSSIQKIQLEDQSKAETSDPEKIFTHFIGSAENIEPVRKSTLKSHPQPKTSALLMMKMKFMRARRQLRQSEEEIKHLKHVIERAHDSANPIGQIDVDEDDEDSDSSDITVDLSRMIIEELSTLLVIDPQQRRFSTELYKICSCVQTVSPAAYRILREILPLPSYQSINHQWRAKRESIKNCLTDILKVPKLLRDYRSHHEIPDGDRIPCTLSFDATSVSQTGFTSLRNMQHCFAFMLLPLSHSLPHSLIHSIPHPSGKMDQKILETRDSLGAALGEYGFSCAFYATDGDNGMSPCHKQAFEKFESFETTESLETIVNHLTSNRQMPLKFWPIPDFLHLLKNSRSRIVRGTLAFDSQSKEISGESLNQILDLGRPLTAHNRLDLIKDDLALELFTLTNLVHLFEEGNNMGAYFLVPFVSLNMAIRNSMISHDTRLGLLQAAFSVFFRMAKNYPATGKVPGIYENSTQTGHRKTLWTKGMCERGCNLCIGLHWAITTHPSDLALGRIGSHSVECHFGTTRSLLRNENRWQRFLSAEVDSLMVREILDELHLAPYIHRFKTTAGYTLGQHSEDLIDCNFEGIIESLELIAGHFPLQTEKSIPYDALFMRPYVHLSELLERAGHIETIPSTSPASGRGIMNRYFAPSATPLGRTEKDERTESSPSWSTFTRDGSSGANERGYKSISLTKETPPIFDLA